MTPEQIAYVKAEIARGVEPPALLEIMRTHGYSDELISALFSAANVVLPDTTESTAFESSQSLPQATAVSTPQQVIATEPVAPVVADNVEAEAPRSNSKFKIILIVLGVLIVLGLVAGGIFIMARQADLNETRERGNDAFLKSTLTTKRVVAEDYYDDQQAYTGFCETVSEVEIDCVDDAEEYRLSTRLSDGSYFCIDNINGSATVAAAPEGVFCSN